MRYLENYIYEKYDGKMWFGDIRITLKSSCYYFVKLYVNRWFQLVYLNEILEMIEDYFLKRIIIDKNSFKVKQNHSEKTLYTINFKFKVIR